MLVQPSNFKAEIAALLANKDTAALKAMLVDVTGVVIYFSVAWLILRGTLP